MDKMLARLENMEKAIGALNENNIKILDENDIKDLQKRLNSFLQLIFLILNID